MSRTLGSTVKASISMTEPAPNREETARSCNFDTRDLSMATARINLRIWTVYSCHFRRCICLVNRVRLLEHIPSYLPHIPVTHYPIKRIPHVLTQLPGLGTTLQPR